MNYKQIPVNSPKVPVHSYSKDGVMRVVNVSDPVYAPNSKGGPQADTGHHQPVGWYADGDMVRSAYTLHEQDDDWGQAGTLVREVMDDAARDRLVSNVVGHLLNAVTEPVLQRAFQYWRSVDKNLGDKIEAGPRQAGRAGPEGRRADESRPREHAGQGLAAAVRQPGTLASAPGAGLPGTSARSQRSDAWGQGGDFRPCRDGSRHGLLGECSSVMRSCSG